MNDSELFGRALGLTTRQIRMSLSPTRPASAFTGISLTSAIISASNNSVNPEGSRAHGTEAYLAGSLKYLPQAEITFDRYHIRKHLSEAIDEIRRVEAKRHKQLLKGTRSLWLQRSANLAARQQDLLDELLHQPLDTVRAYEFCGSVDDRR